MKDLEDYCPPSQRDWRDWLERYHQAKEGVWLILYKTKSPKHNLSWSEAVDEALCFGWIDGIKKKIDAESYRQYFTKRKANSTWSRVNKEKVDLLVDQGLMTAEGYRSIEVAKENGSWTLLDEVEALVVPEDLQGEFAHHPGAREYFDGLSKSAKKILLYWVISAKRPETRQKRISVVAENAAQGLKPKQFR